LALQPSISRCLVTEVESVTTKVVCRRWRKGKSIRFCNRNPNLHSPSPWPNHYTGWATRVYK